MSPSEFTRIEFLNALDNMRTNMDAIDPKNEDPDMNRARARLEESVFWALKAFDK